MRHPENGSTAFHGGEERRYAFVIPLVAATQVHSVSIQSSCDK
jgi:hypothetical protein